MCARKLILIALIASLAGLTAIQPSQAQSKPDLTARPAALRPGEIPKNVRFRFAENGRVIQEAERLKRILSGAGLKERLFDGVLICGPGYWKELKATKLFGNTNAPTATVSVMVGSQAIGLEGRILRDRGEEEQLQKFLVKSLADDGGFTVRAMTSDEMALWWTFISFDIEEPVFIVESRKHRFVLDLHAPSMIQLDDLNHLKIIMSLIHGTN
jgi:hypothetical protein